MTIDFGGETHVLEPGIEMHVIYEDNGRVVLENKGNDRLALTSISGERATMRGLVKYDMPTHGSSLVVKIEK